MVGDAVGGGELDAQGAFRAGCGGDFDGAGGFHWRGLLRGFTPP